MVADSKTDVYASLLFLLFPSLFLFFIVFFFLLFLWGLKTTVGLVHMQQPKNTNYNIKMFYIKSPKWILKT